MPLPEKSCQILWKLRSGIQVDIENYCDWAIVGEIWMDQEYDQTLRLLHDKIFFAKRPIRVVDLGCNVGYFALYAADKLLQWEHDFLIECVDANSEVTEEAFKRFRRQPSNVLVNKVAVYTGLLGEKEGYGYLTRAYFHPTSVRSTEGVPVKLLNLDTTLEPGPIDLCKIDIEGSEENFLQHNEAFMRRCSLVALELHKKQCDADRCEKYLASYGFQKVSVGRSNDVVETAVWKRIN